MSLFLLGAGFNCDAAQEAGPIQFDCSYPVVADILKLCFELDSPPDAKSVEDLFSDAQRAGNHKPLVRLLEKLMEADYYLAARLGSPGASNRYQEFFGKFDDGQFLTFNYDSLPEIFLTQLGRWYPEDGYGVPVTTDVGLESSPPAKVKSTSLVLHLHGCLCVYTTSFDIAGDPSNKGNCLVPRTDPLYAFDPDSIALCFLRYKRKMSPTGFVRIEERVIAPVPDKAEGLKQRFIRETYREARSLVRESGVLVAIGYSFSALDSSSYHPILQSLDQSVERKLILICPDANEILTRIKSEYPRLHIKSVAKTFKHWAMDSFRY